MSDINKEREERKTGEIITIIFVGTLSIFLLFKIMSNVYKIEKLEKKIQTVENIIIPTENKITP